MPLVKGLVRVDREGKIGLPRSVRVAMDLKEKDVVELKLMGSGRLQKLVLSKHTPRR